jgi:hypothetical protein
MPILRFLYHRYSHSVTWNTRWAFPKLIKEDPFRMQSDDILELSAGKHSEGTSQGSHDFLTINACTCVLTNSVKEPLADASFLFKVNLL